MQTRWDCSTTPHKIINQKSGRVRLPAFHKFKYMLFDVSKNEAIDVPEYGHNEMVKTYPEFYAGQPLKIKTLTHKLRKEVQMRSDAREDQRYRKNRVQAHNPIGWRAKGEAITPERKQLYFQYTEFTPVPNNGRLVFSEPFVDIHDGMHIHPHQEDLLFAIHYGCKHIAGTKASGLDPTFEFDRPAAKATSEIESNRKEREIKDFVYETVSYENILKGLSILGKSEQVIAGDERGMRDVNRVALYDHYKKGSEATRKNILEVIGFVKTDPKALREEYPSDLVTRLVGEDKIKLGDGGWYDKDKRGAGDKFKTKPFFETTLEGDDARFALMDFWKANPSSFEEFKKL